MRIPTNGATARFGIFALAAALVIGLVLYGALTHGRKENEPSTKTREPADGVLHANNFADSLPKQGGPPGYVSSAACKECHRQQFDSWWRSYHRQMTQVMDTNNVKANFNDVTMDSGPARFTLHSASNRYWVDIQAISDVETARLTNGPPPAPLRLPIEMMTGSHHFQVFWMPTGQGNRQVGFPFTWLVAEKHWVPRNDAFIRDPDFVAGAEQWNRSCSLCHTTGVRPRRDAAQKLYDTRVTELGIACEACHGPGEAHVAAERHRGQGSQAGDFASEIVQPAHRDHVRSSEICGFCHSMKKYSEASWFQNGFSYRPGDDLEK